MDWSAYFSAQDALKAETKVRARDLAIKHFGACPNHKGHFDWPSFRVGIIFGAAVILAVVAIIIALTPHAG